MGDSVATIERVWLVSLGECCEGTTVVDAFASEASALALVEELKRAESALHANATDWAEVTVFDASVARLWRSWECCVDVRIDVREVKR